MNVLCDLFGNVIKVNLWLIIGHRINIVVITMRSRLSIILGLGLYMVLILKEVGPSDMDLLLEFLFDFVEFIVFVFETLRIIEKLLAFRFKSVCIRVWPG